MHSIYDAFTLQLESFPYYHVQKEMANEKHAFINVRRYQLTQENLYAMVVSIQLLGPICQFNPNVSGASTYVKMIIGAYRHI